MVLMSLLAQKIFLSLGLSANFGIYFRLKLGVFTLPFGSLSCRGRLSTEMPMESGFLTNGR